MSEEIYDSALAVNGIDKQMRKALEEMHELSIEILAYLDGEGNIEHLATESADVDVSLSVVKHFLNKISENEFNQHYDLAKRYKTDRLAIRIQHIK